MRGPVVAGACAFGLLFGCLTAPRAQAPDVVETFRAQVRDIQAQTNAPALSVAVFGGGGLRAAVVLGFADAERQVAATNASLFRVGSVSKLLTASAALRLAQSGRLDLDAPISRFLRDVPADRVMVTPRQLAGHLAGFAQYGRDDYISTRHFTDVMQTLPRLFAQPLVAPPGTRYSYSSYGFNVLGAVLQAAAGRTYEDLVAREVLTPLGLGQTTLDDGAPARVVLYSRDQDRLSIAPPSDLSDRWPSGGYLSTAADLARFSAGAVAVPFLSESSRRLILTPQTDASGKETSVGIGWRIGQDRAGRRFLHHGGDALGGRAFVLTYPDQGVAIAMVANLSFAAFDERQALALVEPFLP